MRISPCLLPLVLSCASVPTEGNEIGPECVQAFAESQLPNPWDVQLYKLDQVALFSVEYGTAQDCPSGCFNSSAIGLMWTCEDLKWLHADDYDGVEFREETLVNAADLEELGGAEFIASLVERYPHLRDRIERGLRRLQAR
jgi:hypothetical protein